MLGKDRLVTHKVTVTFLLPFFLQEFMPEHTPPPQRNVIKHLVQHVE